MSIRGRLLLRYARRPRPIIAACFATLLIGVWGLTVVRNRQQIAMDTELLVSQIDAVGRSGPRLTGVADSSAPAVRRESDGKLSPDGLLAMARLQKQVPEALPTRAVAALASAYAGRGDFGAALDLLQPAQLRQPDDVDLAAARAAVYYWRGEPGDRMRAFEQASAALAHRPTDSTALFNVALTGERLLPRTDGRSAWDRYLAAEHNPERQRDTRARLDAQAQTPAETPQSSDTTRTDLLDSLLPAWASTCLGSAPDERAQRARVVAAAAQPVFNTDHAFADLASRLSPSPTSRCDARVAAAVQRFAQARDLYTKDRLADAEPLFQEVAAQVADLVPALALQARLSRATAAYFRGARDDGRREFDRVTSEAEQRGYWELLGRAHWMRGYAFDDARDYEPAVDAYSRALDAYSEARSVDGIASAHSLIAGALDWLGQYQSSWRHRELALADLARMTDSRARSTILTAAITAASRDGLRLSALQLSAAKLAESAVQRSATRRIQALIELGELQLGTSDRARASAMLADAESALAGIPPGAGRDRLEARLHAVRAAHERDPQRATLLFGRALDLYQRSGAETAVARVLLARARAWRRGGNDQAAEADLRQGIGIVERARATLNRADFRLSYVDEVWDLFDDLLELDVSRGNLTDALDVAERARARELRETLMRRAAAPAPVPMAAPAAARTTRVYYLLLREQLVTWLVDGAHVSSVVQQVSRDRLTGLAREFTTCVASAETIDACDARALTDLLLTPILRRIPTSTAIAIVPDPAMQQLPFVALRNPFTGHLLLEDHIVSFIPTLTTTPAAVTTPARRALVVGNPLAAGSRRLSGADDEARAVASIYDGATLLMGAEASRVNFLNELPRADLVHFAGHAIADPDVPDFARLVLAPAAAHQDSLYAYQIAQLQLSRAPVVVLAACETAVGHTSRSEGSISLARAFMQAGARDVIATLWAIDDASAQSLFVSMHRGLRRGDQPALAVQRAQLDMLRSREPGLRAPATWASVVAWTTVVH
jgi:CHAT domain-containing protein